MTVHQVLFGTVVLDVAVQDEGAPVGQFIALNFVGAGVTAAAGAPGVCNVTIPGGGGAALTVQDGLGVVVPGVTLITLTDGSVLPGAPGEVLIVQAPVRVSDPFGNDAIYRQLNFTNMFAGAGAPGVVDIAGLAPATAGEARFAAYATSGGGDLEYAGTLRFIGVPETPTFYAAPRIDQSVGYCIVQFTPQVSTTGAGNGFQFFGQDALPGSGDSGGDVGMQGGKGDTPQPGGTAFMQAGPGSIPSDDGYAELRDESGAAIVRVGGANNGLAFFANVPESQATVLGSRGGNAALAALLTALADYGLIIDGTTP
jgi:hypothetical protein